MTNKSARVWCFYFIYGLWSICSASLQESEWLRITLHKWLDDEYCPEATNVEISKVAALSYYESLMAKETDLGEILLKMAVKLERISFQESFHGAFSSANAAVNLILQRIVQDWLVGNYKVWLNLSNTKTQFVRWIDDS